MISRLRPTTQAADVDADLARLAADLGALYRAEPPPGLRAAGGAALAERAADIPNRRRPLRPLTRRGPALAPSRPAGLVAAVLLAAVVGVAAATGVLSPLVERALRMDPGTARIATEDRGVAVNQSRTADGFTVTVERVYADPLQVTVAYSISGPRDREYNNFGLLDHHTGLDSPTLLNARGEPLPHGPFGWGTGVEDGAKAGVDVYRPTAALTQPLQPIALRWVVPVVGVIEPADAGGNGRPGRTCDGPVCFSRVEGPFVFDFTVPVEPGLDLRPELAREADGTVVTLERVVAAPTGTRVELRGVAPNVGVALHAGGRSYALTAFGWPCPWSAEDTMAFDTAESLLGVGGPWRVTVDVARTLSAEERGCPALAGGPWVFELEVPSPAR